MFRLEDLNRSFDYKLELMTWADALFQPMLFAWPMLNP